MDLREFYEHNHEFKSFVDKMADKYDASVEDMLEMYSVQMYANYIKGKSNCENI